MTGYWDIDGSSGSVDEFGNTYMNDSFRTNVDGEIEELSDKGWEFSSLNSMNLGFDVDDEGQMFSFHADSDGNEIESITFDFSDDDF